MMGEVMHDVRISFNFCVGLHHCDAEDALLLHGGLHHFELVTKK